jgi:hypothetical protein
MDERPTSEAIQRFGRAANKSYLFAIRPTDLESLGWAVNSLAGGLMELSKAMRQNYQLLEEIQKQLKQLQRPPGRF